MRRLTTPVGASATSFLLAALAAGEPQRTIVEDASPVRGRTAAAVVDSTEWAVRRFVPAGSAGPLREVHSHAVPGDGIAFAPDGFATPRSPSAAGNSVALPATVGVGFAGLSQNGWKPPDPNLAVGPAHVVEVVNESIAFYDRAGALLFSQFLNDTGAPGYFWEAVGGGTSTFDSKCLYDPFSARFVVVSLERITATTEAFIDLAVSDDSDPNGAWFKYRTPAVTSVLGNPHWVDYPGLGVDAGAIYVTANLFAFGGGFGGVKFRVFEKAPLLTGAPAATADLLSTSAGSVQAAHHFGFPAAPFFASASTPSTVHLRAIVDPLGSPSLVLSSVPVAPFSSPFDIPNAGTTDLLDTVDARIMNATWRGGLLHTAHAVQVGGKVVARWYEFATNAWPTSGAPTLVQSGEVDAGSDPLGAPIHTWFPAIASNACGDVGIVFARSSANEFAGTYATGRRASDPPGTMAPMATLHVGTSPYEGDRWGDYFGIAVDPLDDTTFWGAGEHADGLNFWGTWIGSFTVGAVRTLAVESTGAAGALVSVAPTDCDGNGAGATNFGRTFVDGTAVTLAAPSSASGQSFHRWTLDGANQTPGQTVLGVSMNADRTAIARYLPCAASAIAYGTGWPGTLGVPTLATSADPVLGTSPNLLLSNSRGVTTASLVVFGLAPASLPTAFGGTLLVATPAVLAQPTLAPGIHALPAPIPDDPSLCGGILYLQAAVVDPGASAGIAFSAGLEITLGA